MYTAFFRGGYPSLVTSSPKKIKHNLKYFFHRILNILIPLFTNE